MAKALRHESNGHRGIEAQSSYCPSILFRDDAFGSMQMERGGSGRGTLFWSCLWAYDRKPPKPNRFAIPKGGNKIIIFHWDFLIQKAIGLVNGDDDI